MTQPDLSAIRKKLEQLQTSNTRSNNLWKPPVGKTQIRLVPYKKSTNGFPFLELFFHYQIGGKTYLAPTSFGLPDPIEEFSVQLKATGNKEDWNFGRKVEAKMRTFAPVIVRGEEDQGVKFWGFGKTVYQELLELMMDPDFGDISDPEKGTDIMVEYKSAEELGTSFPKTIIRTKRDRSKLTEDKAQLDKWLNDQTEVTEVYPLKEYDELKEILDEWMNPSEDEDGEVKVEAKKEVTENDISSAKKSTVKAEDFDDLFND